MENRLVPTQELILQDFSALKDIACYDQDGRKHLYDIHKPFMDLVANHGWTAVPLYKRQYRDASGKEITIPNFAYYSHIPGAKYAVAFEGGVHGEESSAPNAFAENTDVFLQLQTAGIPSFIIPTANAFGYVTNNRYAVEGTLTYDENGRWVKELPSVGDCDHLLPSDDNPNIPAAMHPSCEESIHISRALYNFAQQHKILLNIDAHDDEDDINNIPPPIFSHGCFGAEDPIAHACVDIILNNNLPIMMSPHSNYPEYAHMFYGTVEGEQERSLDDYISAHKVWGKYLNGQEKWIRGIHARHAIVTELSSAQIDLKKRVAVYSEILRETPRFFQMAVDLLHS